MATITDRQQVINIDQRIASILATGQEYTIVGNRSVKNPALKDLIDLKKFYERRILRDGGSVGKSLPDFRTRTGTGTRELEDFDQVS